MLEILFSRRKAAESALVKTKYIQPKIIRVKI
jgi:hypothetical protein